MLINYKWNKNLWTWYVYMHGVKKDPSWPLTWAWSKKTPLNLFQGVKNTRGQKRPILAFFVTRGQIWPSLGLFRVNWFLFEIFKKIYVIRSINWYQGIKKPFKNGIFKKLLKIFFKKSILWVFSRLTCSEHP